MTDIDFDELDKAVNSALKPALENHDDDQTDSAAPETEKTTESADREPSQPAVIIKPRNTAPLAPTRDRQETASPAIKRTGRFMDMVHPSSDMANEKKLTPAPKVKIMPTENAPKPEEQEVEAEATPVVVEPVKTEEKIETFEPSKPAEPVKSEEPAEPEESPEELVKSEYPDPIDVAGPLSIAEEPETPPAETEAQPKTEPVEAPFLPDAKVEKRPLGGFTPEEAVDAESPDDEESQLPPEADLPAALQSDVVAVESDVLPDRIPGQADDDYDEGEKASHDKKPAHSDSHEDATKPHEVPQADSGVAQSIPQQYHSEPSKADEAPRPVFDTDQYHQPLIAAHAGKKSHVWVFILLILALLAVGGTLGYFAFMSGL